MEKLYHVRKVECVAYLLLKGFEVINKELKNGTVLCYFKDGDDFRKVKDEFYNNALIPALEFSRQVSELKKEFYELKISATAAVQSDDANG